MLIVVRTRLYWVDIGFILLHSINHLIKSMRWEFLYLGGERGASEICQYVKYILIFIIMNKCGNMYGGFFKYIKYIFIFLFMDDFFQLHENIGLYISNRLQLSPVLGFKSMDLGEMMVFGVNFFVFVSLFRRGVRGMAVEHLSVPKNYLVLLAALGFAAVVLDAVHSLVRFYGAFNVAFGILEDGGEMVVTTALLAYTRLVIRDPLRAARPLLGWLGKFCRPLLRYS